jgi:hypothetical protein
MNSELQDLLGYLTPREKDELDYLLTAPGKDRLQELRQDPSQVMSLAGMAPDPWQARLIRSALEPGQESLLLCSRQAGKSQATAGLALARALLVPDSLVLLLAPTERQSAELLQDKIYRLYDALGQPVASRRRQQLSLTLANRSRIIALPDNEAGIRCYSRVALLVIDEAARVPDNLYFAARPMLATSRGSIVALSTPYGQRGWFHDAWTKEPDWTRYSVPASRCPRITAEFLAGERMRMGERWYRQEYDLLFADAVDAVFSQDVIAGAMSPDVQPLFGR